MVVKLNIKIVIVLLFSLFSCKEDKTSKQLKSNKKALDSIAIKNNRQKEYKITRVKNKEIVNTIEFENIVYGNENDFSKIKSVLLETPNEINFTYLHNETNKNGIIFQTFGLNNYLEYKEPYREYCPFINTSKKRMEFILSYYVDSSTVLKISFINGQAFLFGKKHKWITPKVKVADSLDYQHYSKDSFCEANYQSSIHGGNIVKYRNKKYLLFFINDGMWWIHHLFDITDEKNIKYYILNSIYGLEDCYGDFNNDGKLDFKQKYAYLRNSENHSNDKYKTYTLP